MSRRVEHFFAGMALWFVLVGVYSDKLFGSGFIFTEVIQDITNIYGFYPWDIFSAQQIRAGYFPLWNSHNGLGVPHLANMQSAIFYPLNWLKFIFNYWLIIDWLLIIRLWLAGFFLYLFLRNALKLEVISAIFAGLSYALSGYFMRYVYMSHLNVECLIPLQLYLFYQLSQKKSFVYFILCGLGIYLLIAGGFPEASLYAIIFCAIYFISGIKSELSFWRRIFILGAIMFFGFLLASLQWLPFYEYLGQAWTYHQEGAGVKHLDIAYAVSMLLPWFFGKNSESTLISFLVPGMGVVAMIFCLRSILSIGSYFGKIIFWLCSIIFLLGLIYGIPPFILLGKIYPFSVSYNYKYAVPVLSLCVSVLGGYGLELFCKGARMKLDLIALGLVWLWASVNLIIGLMNGFEPFYGFGAHLEMARLFGVILAMLLALSLIRRGFVRFVLVWMVLILCGSAYFDYRMNRGAELSGYLSAQMREAENLRDIFAEPYRYSAEGDILFPNLLLPLGVDELRIYDPVYPRSYVYLMASINGLSGDEEINEHYNSHKLFQIGRAGLNSALTPVLNLMFYSADYELNSRPIAREMLKEGIETGDYAGWSREEVVGISDAFKKCLMTHSNGKLSAELNNHPAAMELYFEAGIASEDNKSQSDGAEFGLFFLERNQLRLGYYRFFNPVLRVEERDWKPVKVKLWSGGERIKISLVSLSGPLGNNEGDYLAWGGLRLYSERYQLPSYENWTEKGELSLNYLREAYPRYFLVQRVGVLPSGKIEDEMPAFRKLSTAQKGFFRDQVVVSEKMEIERSGRDFGGESWVKVVQRESELVELKLRSPVDGFLLASEQYFPGWRVMVDGKESRIYRADLALRTVFIPAGEHKVLFWYEPWSFRVGLMVSLVSVFSSGVALVFWWRKRE